MCGCPSCLTTWLADEKGVPIPPTGGNYPTKNPDPGIRRAQKFSFAQISASMETRNTLNSLMESRQKPRPSPVAPDANEKIVQEQARQLVASVLAEKGHKQGCTCNFCKNKGSFGKKKEGEKEEQPAMEKA
jgi:hypothetical protein